MHCVIVNEVPLDVNNIKILDTDPGWHQRGYRRKKWGPFPPTPCVGQHPAVSGHMTWYYLYLGLKHQDSITPMKWSMTKALVNFQSWCECRKDRYVAPPFRLVGHIFSHYIFIKEDCLLCNWTDSQRTDVMDDIWKCSLTLLLLPTIIEAAIESFADVMHLSGIVTWDACCHCQMDISFDRDIAYLYMSHNKLIKATGWKTTVLFKLEKHTLEILECPLYSWRMNWD